MDLKPTEKYNIPIYFEINKTMRLEIDKALKKTGVRQSVFIREAIQRLLDTLNHKIDQYGRNTKHR